MPSSDLNGVVAVVDEDVVGLDVGVEDAAVAEVVQRLSEARPRTSS